MSWRLDFERSRVRGQEGASENEEEEDEELAHWGSGGTAGEQQ